MIETRTSAVKAIVIATVLAFAIIIAVTPERAVTSTSIGSPPFATKCLCVFVLSDHNRDPRRSCPLPLGAWTLSVTTKAPEPMASGPCVLQPAHA